MSSKLVVTKAYKYFPLRRSLVEILMFKKPRYVRAVDGVSFAVQEGEIFCLAGESGCGKTTTGRLIVRLIDFTGGKALYMPRKEVLSEIPPGFLVDGKYVDLTAKLPRYVDKLLRRDVQIIFQDPYGSLNPRMRVYDILKEPLDIHALGATDDE
ncbi:MAG: ATP-binding cassette domain-containing protein, partial [Sulfolobales archaeon]|nr:ATP-binding cassette domain-containing protein [Sulfolobales archaeon]